MTFTLPDLSYDYNALEPVIDAKTMEIHHTKHHQGYVDKLNKALEGHDNLQNKALEELLSGVSNLPEDIQTAVRNSGGGHANHALFWQTLRSPSDDNAPGDELNTILDATYGSMDAFKEKFSEAATGVFGSGWAWLVADSDNALKIYGTPNQDSPLMNGDTPILGLDVWEHAYYLNYQNKRADYVENFWKIVDWDAVTKRIKQTKQS